MSFFTRLFALISAFFTMVFSPSTTFEKHIDVRVLTYNISFDNLTYERLDAVAQQITAVDPDCFGCQEVKNDSKPFLESRFSDYDSFMVSDETTNTTYNALFWRKSRFTKTDSGSIFLSTIPDKPSTGWDANHRRMLQWVVLRDNKTGFTFVHANVHLDNGGETSRNESIKLINKYLSVYDCPVIISGDFNCRYTGDTIKNFMNMGWQNTMNLSGLTWSTDTYHGYTGSDTNHSPIDHIFVKGNISASDWTIHKEKYNGMYPSDHFALSVNLKIGYTITAKENYEFIKNDK